ncbi:MlaE family ABC transporter permease [Marinobacterium sediminicola]|uniref:Phospholipid/cholesterol/gamma-HCH transport system permease protein n=1 Tax=Marinobacterium sediminicola TaxID=518898 RepID=A0ABY1S0Y9_9GAMM|nr:ABC transporter permease [Marinobacterium sediminicola]ULG69841.1 ABC transporter permease [Marinobacterium sediminicola]SMR75344.1 phospholipid/cholesterol/gamma-HCH transport system permease protein [Marinobacterium sediminicola]
MINETAPAIDSGAVTRLLGAWTLAQHHQLKRLVADTPVPEGQVCLKDIASLDTAGATLLVQWLGIERLEAIISSETDLQPERRALLETLLRAIRREPPPVQPQPPALVQALTLLGQHSEQLARHLWQLSGFVGLVLQSLLGVLVRPSRWRVTALVNQIHQTGLNAVPIVALLTFLVGAVVAFLGATVLGEFGAEIYTVNLVAYSFLREFGVILASILLAGRTASAFTAQIGSMKANEELDALRTLGLNPIELLVIPRVLALLITLPLLTFVAVMSGLFGGALVSLVALDIPLGQYLGILADVPLKHYLVGLAKAPVFAFVVAVIGCMEGFKVSGSAESVGRHTTSSVVQSIFMVILLDAVAAMFFMEMGW